MMKYPELDYENLILAVFGEGNDLEGKYYPIICGEIDEGLDNLEGRDRDIFFQRFNRLQKKLSEIAQQFEISPNRVRQIEEKILRKMRQYGKISKLIIVAEGEPVKYYLEKFINLKKDIQQLFDFFQLGNYQSNIFPETFDQDIQIEAGMISRRIDLLNNECDRMKIKLNKVKEFVRAEFGRNAFVSKNNWQLEDDRADDQAEIMRVRFNKLWKDIKVLNLSKKAYNALRRNGVVTVLYLVGFDREGLEKLDFMGPKTAREIEEKLIDYGLNLGIDLKKYLTEDLCCL